MHTYKVFKLFLASWTSWLDLRNNCSVPWLLLRFLFRFDTLVLLPCSRNSGFDTRSPSLNSSLFYGGETDEVSINPKVHNLPVLYGPTFSGSNWTYWGRSEVLKCRSEEDLNLGFFHMGGTVPINKIKISLFSKLFITKRLPVSVHPKVHFESRCRGTRFYSLP